jgi:hypothetical protein
MKNGNGAEIRVGAQAMTRGDTIREEMPHILRFLRECGRAGAEIGAPDLSAGLLPALPYPAPEPRLRESGPDHLFQRAF